MKKSYKKIALLLIVVFVMNIFSLGRINAEGVAIASKAIGGITAPATGENPVTAVTETAEYTGTVTWNPLPQTFAEKTEYTATITLTPKAGYTLTGITENQFTVDGATTTNLVNSGVITAVFPETEEKGIDYTGFDNMLIKTRLLVRGDTQIEELRRNNILKDRMFFQAGGDEAIEQMYDPDKVDSEEGGSSGSLPNFAKDKDEYKDLWDYDSGMGPEPIQYSWLEEMDGNEETCWDDEIVEVAKEYELDPLLIKLLIVTESRGHIDAYNPEGWEDQEPSVTRDPSLYNPDGGYGLMQVTFNGLLGDGVQYDNGGIETTKYKMQFFDKENVKLALQEGAKILKADIDMAEGLSGGATIKNVFWCFAGVTPQKEGYADDHAEWYGRIRGVDGYTTNINDVNYSSGGSEDIEVSDGEEGEPEKKGAYWWIPVEYDINGEKRTILKYDTSQNPEIPTKDHGKDRASAGYQIEMIVDHITDGLGNGDAIAHMWFNDSQSASTNFVVERSGVIWEVVPINYTAYGNGIVQNPSSQKIIDAQASGKSINAITANIEHEGTLTRGIAADSEVGDLTEEQLQATIWLHKYIINYAEITYGSEILPDRDHIIGHNEIDAVDRFNCPGPKGAEENFSGGEPGKYFPWDQLIDGINGM